MPTAPIPDSTPTSVYRYYDEIGVLIYVGITSTGTVRNKQHNSEKEWWRWVVTQKVEHFQTRAKARARETALITALHPPFNKQHNVDHAELRSMYLAAREAGVYTKLRGNITPESNVTIVTGAVVVDHEAAAVLVSVLVSDVPNGGLIKHAPNRALTLETGEPLGMVLSVTRHQHEFEIKARMRQALVFGEANVWLRPTAVVNGLVQYEIKKVIALNAWPLCASEAS